MMSFKQWKAIPTILVLVGIVCSALVWSVLAGDRSQAQASTFTVNTTLDEQDAHPGDGICETAPGNGACSLRAAVQESNSLPNADVIVLPAGVYTLTLAGILEDQARYGDLDILNDLTLQGVGAGITIVDGNQLDRVIEILGESSEVDISGVTIRNGNVDFPTSIGEGPPWLVENGGCVLSLAILTLRHSVLTGCRAGSEGGGIYAERALVMEDTMVLGNQAGDAGGGVSSFSGMAPVTPTPPPFATPTPASTPQPFPSPTWTPFPFETPTPTATSSPVPVPLEQTGVILTGDVSPVLLTPTSTSTPTPTSTSTPVYPPAAAGGVILRNSVIEDNVAVLGGGVYNKGQLTLDNVVLRHNRAVDTAAPLCCSDGGGLPVPSGGGIYSEGLLTLVNSQIISNTASGPGGGMVNRSMAESYRSDFSDNRAGTNGGGILNFNWLRLNDSTVRSNVADDFGGGIVNDEAGYYQSALILEGSTVSGNMSHGRGGGIANGTLDYAYTFRQERLWLINSTVSGNVADGSGGGIYTGLGEFNRVFLDNATITANVADADGNDEGDGGGLFNRLGQVQLRNSILAANQDHSQGTQRPDCWTPRRLYSEGYNLIGNASTCPLEGFTVGNLLGVDPRLGPLQDNGGSTQTHSLLSGSQAIDAGNPDGCTGSLAGFLTVDQRGYMRTVDGNGDGQQVCDIGAYEFNAVRPSYRFLPLLLAY